jgi:hypothetical protein
MTDARNPAIPHRRRQTRSLDNHNAMHAVCAQTRVKTDMRTLPPHTTPSGLIHKSEESTYDDHATVYNTTVSQLLH